MCTENVRVSAMTVMDHRSM